MMTSPSEAQQTQDFLDEDVLKCNGQVFAAISVVSSDPEKKQRLDAGFNDKIAIKIRGVFSTKEEAEKHINKLMKTDGCFDIYVVDMYKWLLLPPDNDLIENHEYQEQFLNDLIKGHKENQLLAQQHFEERKRDLMQKELTSSENNK